MSGEERRNKLLHYLSDNDRPVSGTELAQKFGVSRQVIVQDIALLRSGHAEIIATNRGYLLYDTAAQERIKKIKLYRKRLNFGC